jgi:hypothetical protein
MTQRAGFLANKLGRGSSHLSFLEHLLRKVTVTITKDSTTVSRNRVRRMLILLPVECDHHLLK